MDGKNPLWTEISLDGWRTDNKYGAKMFKNVKCCQICPCSLFPVIKHISTGWYVYELTSLCPPKINWLVWPVCSCMS